jgi:UDP-N-acetyl-D-mannosaminuronate dehydrogenase
MQITVVGQGYVGLPLAIAAANAGYTVFGLDNNEEKIAELSSGKSIIED